MANSDGSIVLSVTIDTDEIKQGTTKITKELEKQFASEQKVLREAKKTAQAKTKTATEQSKLNKAVYNELSAEQKAEASQSRKIKLKADENAAIYKELELSEKAEEAQNRKNAAQAKYNAEIYKELEAENRAVASQELGAQAEAKTVQEKQKALKATFDREAAEIRSAKAATDAQISEEKLASVKAKSASDEILAEEKIRENKTKNVILEEKAAQAQEKTKQEIIKTENEQRKLSTATNSVATALRKMAYSLGIMLSFREVFRFFDNASELASQTEANLKRLGALYGETAESVYDFANANAEAFGMSKTAAYDAAADYGNIFTTFASGAESAELTNQMLQATAVIASQTGRTYEDVFEKIRSGLYGNTRAIDDLGLSVRQSSLMQTKAYAEISENGTKSWNELTDSELQNARALGIIEQAADKYGDEILQSTALIRSQFNAAWEDFKTSWGTLVNRVLAPILESLSKILNYLTSCINSMFQLMGFSDVSSSIKNNIEAQSEFTDEVEDTNAELKKTLASFDDLQILDFGSEKKGTASGGDTNVGGISSEGTLGATRYDTQVWGDFGERIGAIALEVSSILAAIAAWKISDALSKDAAAFLGKLNKIFGIAEIIAGTILLCYEYSDAWVNGLDWKNLLGIISGMAILIDGIARTISTRAATFAAISTGITLIVLAIKDIIENGPSATNIIGLLLGVCVTVLGTLTAIGKMEFLTMRNALLNISSVFAIIYGVVDALTNGLDSKNFLAIVGGAAALLTLVFKNLKTGMTQTAKMTTSVTLLVAAIGMIIVGVEDIVKNGASLQNLMIIAIGLVVGLNAVFLIFNATLMANPVVLIVEGFLLLAAAIAGLVIEEGKAKTSEDELQKSLDQTSDSYEDYMRAVDSAEGSLENLKEQEEETGYSGKELAKQIEEGLVTYEHLTDKQKIVYDAYLENEKAQERYRKSVQSTYGELQIEVNKHQAVIAALEKEQKAKDKLKDANESYTDAQSSYASAVDAQEDALNKLNDIQSETNESGSELYGAVEVGKITYEQMTEAQRKTYKAYLDWKKASLDLEKATEDLTKSKKELKDADKEATKTAIDHAKAVASETGEYENFSEKLVDAYENGYITIDEFQDYVNSAFDTMDDKTWELFRDSIPSYIVTAFDSNRYATVVKDFTNMLDGIKKETNEGWFNWDPSWQGPVKPTVKTLPLPHYAKGAVIPANREFLAVLGDQKSGYNVEAPAKLIKQMAMEAIAESGMVSSPTVTKEEHYYLDKSELMSIIYKLVKDGERVSGTSLA